MTVVLLHTGSRFKPEADLLCEGAKWVYLGKDLIKREVLSHKLGEKQLLPLGDRLHRIAEKLRQPFLDFIADLGRIQQDQLGWWSSTCAWKNSTASDLFLLICYEHTVDELLTEQGDTPLIIVVEDSWFYNQLKETYGGRSDVQFQQNPRLWTACLKADLLGMTARIVWAIRLVRNFVVQRWFWKGSVSQCPERQVAFHSYPQVRCLRGEEGWNDPYLGDLDRQLEAAGFTVRRFSNPELGGLEEALARREHYFIPLILFLSFQGLFRALLATWRPRWPAEPEICGLPVNLLLLREWCLDRWRSSYLLYRVFLDCAMRFFEREPVMAVVYPYENHPWEKMLILAARRHKVATLGHQHGGGIATFMLPYFFGQGEAEYAPMPDIIMTSGPYSHQLLASGGTPPDRLVMGGSLRYHGYAQMLGKTPSPGAVNTRRVLVALPIEKQLAQHLILALRRAFPDGGVADGITFLVKAHPMCPIDPDSFQWPVATATGAFQDAVHSSTIVLYAGTSTGLEALAMGRRALRYRSELLLNTDRGEFLTSPHVMDCGDSDMRTCVLSAVAETGESPTSHAIQAILVREVFPPVDREAWIRTVQRLYRMEKDPR